MRINSKIGSQHATYDGEDAGEGLAIFLSQNAAATARFRFLVKAITSQGPLQVGVFYSSPPGATVPTGPLTRMVASAVCPGAKGWAVEISTANNPPGETADVTLTSSKCYTAPVGVTRVSERYRYDAGSVLGSSVVLPLLPGRKMKSWGAVAPGTSGSVQLSSNNAAIITIPAGMSVSSEPGTELVDPTETITFTNVDYFIEYLESA